jgi:hypothetical protein
MNATIPKLAATFGLDQNEHSDVLLECKHGHRPLPFVLTFFTLLKQ